MYDLDIVSDVDDTINTHYLYIPLLLWVAWNVGFVLVAAILVAYGEVSVPLWAILSVLYGTFRERFP